MLQGLPGKEYVSRSRRFASRCLLDTPVVVSTGCTAPPWRSAGSGAGSGAGRVDRGQRHGCTGAVSAAALPPLNKTNVRGTSTSSARTRMSGLRDTSQISSINAQMYIARVQPQRDRRAGTGRGHGGDEGGPAGHCHVARAFAGHNDKGNDVGNRPNSTSRVLSGCSSNPNLPIRGPSSARNRRASF